MEVINKLKEQGWHLTLEGVKKCDPQATCDVKKIIAVAMNVDFREIAAGALPNKREDYLPGKIVLQIQKIRNISAPKANEESKTAPRLLQLELSDGQNSVQALELENIAALNLNVPPGTKIYLRAERLQLMSGYLVLKANDVQVLGGKVEALFEKWEMARTILKYAKSGRRPSGASGPPPWIAFGKKLESSSVKGGNERNFKSLQAAMGGEKESKENEEFNAARTAAISEANKAGSKKIFGGGNLQILDYNVKKILDKGYSEEDAKNALRSTNNNLERALYNLKRRQDYKKGDAASSNTLPTSTGGGKFAKMERKAASAKEEAAAAKPAGNVSLFDFLTEKLPVSTESSNTTTAAPISSSSAPPVKHYNPFSSNNNNATMSSSREQRDNRNNNTNNKFENNISSSFASRPAGGGNSSRGGRNGPRNEERTGDRSERRSNNERNSAAGGGRGNRNQGTASTAASKSQQANEQRSSGSNRNERNSNYRDNENSRSNQNADAQNSNQNNANSRYGNERNKDGQRYNNAGAASGEGSSYGSGQNRGGNRERKRGDNRRSAENDRRSSNREARNSEQRSQPQNAPNASNNNNRNNRNAEEFTANPIDKLTQATLKMKIDGGSRQSQQRGNDRNANNAKGNQQQQQSTRNQSKNSYSSSQPTQSQQFGNSNGFDRSKIMGFQNKQTNDLAMSLLKTQGLLPATGNNHSNAEPPVQIMSPNIAADNAYMNVMSSLSYSAAAPMQSAYNVNAGAQAGGYGMLPSGGWPWKVGDLCMAKYWDDGKYYEAEITALADKTCVVFFLNYGNHEEVLKTDCLPITDANHMPINNFQQQQGYGAQQQSHGYQQRQYNAANQQRFRGERQMYVPPHKRQDN